MKIIAIVAADEQYGIGKDNQMMWQLPNDFKFFKAKTLGHPIIMGRNTFMSIGKPLPGRENIIVSTSMSPTEGVTVLSSISKAISYCREQGVSTAFIIGGGSIYEQTQELWDEVLLTLVHTVIADATVFFPKLNPDHWMLIWEEAHAQDDRHLYPYTFQQWRRIKK